MDHLEEKYMDIESIKTFMVLAHTKNYTRTANQLFVAQSTVTNRIHELEKELGFRLFIRTNRSVELTPKGEQFRLYAEKLIDLTDTALAEISASLAFPSQSYFTNLLKKDCGMTPKEYRIRNRNNGTNLKKQAINELFSNP